jgi:DNA-binding NarL/FixJ family response regulator
METLIIDDHALFREGSCHVLYQIEGDVTIHEAFDCDRALEYAAEHPNLDLVLLDLNMLSKDGFEVLDIFSQRYPVLPIIMLSALSFQQNMTRASDKGAAAYIDKKAASKAMLDALHIVLGACS